MRFPHFAGSCHTPESKRKINVPLRAVTKFPGPYTARNGADEKAVARPVQVRVNFWVLNT
jgi:hypothetical protein